MDVAWVDAEHIERDGADGARSPASHGILVPGRLRRPRHRGQDPGGALRARAAGAVLRHLPRHAVRGHRVRAPRVRPRAAPTPRSSIRRAPHPVIDLLPEQRDVADKGGTMRARPLSDRARRGQRRPRALYGQGIIQERHRHRYEVNNDYLADAREERAPRLRASGPRSSSSRSSSCPSTRTSWPASSIPSSARGRGSRIRSSPAS